MPGELTCKTLVWNCHSGSGAPVSKSVGARRRSWHREPSPQLNRRYVPGGQTPHHLAALILHDREYVESGKAIPFRQSELGMAIDQASVRNATPLYQLCPTALVFGMWDSTGPKGGAGAKFERAMVSEIVGVGCPYDFESEEHRPKNRGVRNDPVSIRGAVRVRKLSPQEWEVAGDPKAKNTSSPAEINHSNVPFDGDNCGVTIDYAEQTSVLSLAALRRIRFPQPRKPWEATAQTVLAALAPCGAELAAEPGMDLRSRCLLWPEEARTWELLDQPGQPPQVFMRSAEPVIAPSKAAVEAAEKASLTWHTKPCRLSPSRQLVKLVRMSQEQAAALGPERDGA